MIHIVKGFGIVKKAEIDVFLNEMGIQHHLTCLLRNQYAGQEATVRTGHGTTDWFQIGKGVCQGCILSLLLNMLSRLVLTFLPRSKHLLISWLQSQSAVILEPQKIKSDTVSTVSPSISHEVMGPDAMILGF